MERRHILFLITSLRYGGAERVVVNLSRFFAESAGYRVSVMVLEEGADYTLSDKVEVTRLRSGRSNTFEKIISLISDPFRLKRFIASNNVDIVLSFMQRPNAINMLSKALGARHKAYVNVRCRMKVHYEKELRGAARVVGWALFSWLWKYADKTIVNSRDIKDDVVSLFNVSPERVEVVYNPLDLKEIRERSKEYASEEWFKKKDAPLIINVASLTRPKGHTYLLRAFARVAAHRPARLVLIGDGELKESLLSEVKNLDIADKVLFLGWRDNPYKYMARSNLFVLSSVYEGFPNALLEAMACGCPVVSFNCPSGPWEMLSPKDAATGDIIRARYGLLVNKMDDASLSKAIELLLDDKDSMAFYAQAGPQRASQFDLPIIAKAYEKMLS